LSFNAYLGKRAIDPLEAHRIVAWWTLWARREAVAVDRMTDSTDVAQARADPLPRRLAQAPDVRENPVDDAGPCDERDDAHLGPKGWAAQRLQFIDPA